MLTLRTLGECVIEIDGQYHGPQAPHVFGLLLYLAVERGRRVPRPTLLALLYPDVAEANAGHSFRQLLHRCRQIGAPLETGLEGVSLRTDEVEDDYSALFVPAPESRLDLQRATGGFLPGYAPRISDRFREWVEQQRAHVHGRIRRTLLAELEAHERAGRWEAAERTARCCLAIDPMNEQATFGLASALAAAGSRAQAVRLLDQYIAEAGASADAVRIPATVLRRRIAERLPAMEYDATRATFVGRAAEMAELNALLRRARDGECCTAVVWGEAGIGKTRLVAEFCKAAVLAGATVLRAVSQPHDVRRPMGAFLDLTPRLLKLPGALGTSPESMRYLQRLVTFDPQLDQPLTPEMRDPEYLAACITRALSELLDAVTSEAPLIVVVEDAQWLDRVSTLVLGDLLAERCQRRLLLVATWRATEDPTPATPFPERTRSLRVPALESADAERLVSEQLRQLAVPPVEAVLEWSVRTAQGNPFFLHELARHYAVHREVGEVPGSLRDLLRARMTSVRAESRQTLVAIAILGSFAALPRLEGLLQLGRQRFTGVLEQLEVTGLIRCTDGLIEVAHPLVSELAYQSCPVSVRHLLELRAAELLADEDPPSIGRSLASAALFTATGESSRGALALRRAARHLTTLGQWRDAFNLLERAADACSDVLLRQTLQLERLAVAHALRDPLLLTSSAESITHDTDERVPQSLRLAAEVALVWARYEFGDSPRQVLTQLAALELSTASPETRTQAVYLELLIHEGFADRDGATVALAKMKALRPSSAGLEHQAAHLIFHTRFGTPASALALADAITSDITPGQITAVQARFLCNAAGVYMELGYPQKAAAFLPEVYEACMQLRLPTLALSAAGNGLFSALCLDDFEAARVWDARALELRTLTARTFHLNYLACSCILALRTSDSHTAASRQGELSQLAAPGTWSHAQAEALGAFVRIAAHTDADALTDHSLEQLVRRHLGDDQFDLVIEAFVAVHRHNGDERLALELLERHLAARRSSLEFRFLIPELGGDQSRN